MNERKTNARNTKLLKPALTGLLALAVAVINVAAPQGGTVRDTRSPGLLSLTASAIVVGELPYVDLPTPLNLTELESVINRATNALSGASVGTNCMQGDYDTLSAAKTAATTLKSDATSFVNSKKVPDTTPQEYNFDLGDLETWQNDIAQGVTVLRAACEVFEASLTGNADNSALLAKIAEANAALENLTPYPQVGSLPQGSNTEAELRTAITTADATASQAVTELRMTQAVAALSDAIRRFDEAVLRDVKGIARAGDKSGSGAIFGDLTAGGKFKIIGSFENRLSEVTFSPVNSGVTLPKYVVTDYVDYKGDDLGEYDAYLFDLGLDYYSSAPSIYARRNADSPVVKLNTTGGGDRSVYVTLNVPPALRGYEHYAVFHFNDDIDIGVRSLPQYTTRIYADGDEPSALPGLTDTSELGELNVKGFGGVKLGRNVWESLNVIKCDGETITFVATAFSPFAIVGYNAPPAPASAPLGGNSGGGQAVYITSETTATEPTEPAEPTTAADPATATSEPATAEPTTDEPATLDTPSYTQSEQPSAEPPTAEQPSAEPPGVNSGDGGGNPGNNNSVTPAHGRGGPVVYPIDTGAAVVPVGIVALACVVTSAAAMLLKHRRK